ncbi:MAG TPA: hypothetical protein VES96_01345 [Nitrospiraceae bacterium]|nr:hypothetical protein [Nitrospiraceae bacterium]
MGEPTRIKTIKAELEKSAKEYLETREQLEVARVAFEAARERLAGVKKHATEMLETLDWYSWQRTHKDVRYAATPAGEAILEVLWNRTFDSAYAHLNKDEHPKFIPEMTLSGIQMELENGGFDFNTSTPLREVNAALMQLKGVTKLPSGNYRRDDADQVLDRLRRKYEEDEAKKGK